MRKRLLLYSILFLILVQYVTISCTFDNEEDLLKDYVCDTTSIVYSDLTYIFSGICANCHSEVFTYHDEIMMDSYKNVKESINTGLVWPAINHANGSPPMPNGLPKLSKCELDKIKAWMDAGMPQN